MDLDELAALVRTIPDFPKPGILFRDITTLLADAQGFSALVGGLAAVARPLDADIVVGIEARGFVLGAALAHALGLGFVPIRKPGKLPGKTVGSNENEPTCFNSTFVCSLANARRASTASRV